MGIFLMTEYPPVGAGAANKEQLRVRIAARLQARLNMDLSSSATLCDVPEICLKVPLHKSELHSNHELKLPRQPRPGVGRRGIVVVDVEVHGCVDGTEAALRCQVACACRSGIEDEVQCVRIAELHVIENVERLHGEQQRGALGELRFLGEGEIDLPIR